MRACKYRPSSQIWWLAGLSSPISHVPLLSFVMSFIRKAKISYGSGMASLSMTLSFMEFIAKIDRPFFHMLMNLSISPAHAHTTTLRIRERDGPRLCAGPAIKVAQQELGQFAFHTDLCGLARYSAKKREKKDSAEEDRRAKRHRLSKMQRSDQPDQNCASNQQKSGPEGQERPRPPNRLKVRPTNEARLCWLLRVLPKPPEEP